MRKELKTSGKCISKIWEGHDTLENLSQECTQNGVVLAEENDEEKII
jgi:hypothetical protein